MVLKICSSVIQIENGHLYGASWPFVVLRSIDQHETSGYIALIQQSDFPCILSADS